MNNEQKPETKPAKGSAPTLVLPQFKQPKGDYRLHAARRARFEGEEHLYVVLARKIKANKETLQFEWIVWTYDSKKKEYLSPSVFESPSHNAYRNACIEFTQRWDAMPMT